MNLVLKADGTGYGYRCRVHLKKWKARTERRKAKRNPECAPTYGFHRGWLT